MAGHVGGGRHQRDVVTGLRLGVHGSGSHSTGGCGKQQATMALAQSAEQHDNTCVPVNRLRIISFPWRVTRFYERSDWTEMVGKRVRIQNVVKSTREERIQWLKRKKERNIKKGINGNLGTAFVNVLH